MPLYLLHLYPSLLSTATCCELADYSLKPIEYNDVPSPDSPGTVSLYQETMALKNKNPDLKVLIAVGGWCAAGGGGCRQLACCSLFMHSVYSWFSSPSSLPVAGPLSGA